MPQITLTSCSPSVGQYTADAVKIITFPLLNFKVLIQIVWIIFFVCLCMKYIYIYIFNGFPKEHKGHQGHTGHLIMSCMINMFIKVILK